MKASMAAAHRQAFMAALDGGVAVLRSGSEIIRNRDTHYRFRPDSDFWYLTGFREPDAVAVLRPGADSERYVLFVRPRDPEQEVWTGRRAGLEGARERFGADAAYPIETLDEHLPRLLRGFDSLTYATGDDLELDRKLLGWIKDTHLRSRDGVRLPAQVNHPGATLHELRLRKSPDEVAALKRCAELTDQGHRAAMSALREGQGEWEIEALVDGSFRRGGGWGPGYPSICAAGANATILHYNTNEETVPPGALMLLDAGAEAEGYTADVTRCFPSGARFTPPQRELYELVLAAQLAAIGQVRPGAPFHSVHEVALRRLVEGLVELELLPAGVDANLESGAYRRYYMHRTSHWLGLDVHDVGAYYTADRKSRPLEPGMVLTVEPGLYVPAGDERAPERFRGIGVRIEDDVLVTPAGHEVLTAAIPKTIADVEALR
ncbi:MAG TPA: aminopeptidase P N-terminal domain-containing protein [Planctomycetota bacterium]|nr:aminopeptidase P N-terminal domain-containing protein [Planctomycetota bacterium]